MNSITANSITINFMTPERKNRLTSVLQKRQNDLTVILENVHNPHNISAIMRTCDAIGIQEIYIINTTTPPIKYWGRRSNAGTAGWLTIFQFINVEDCLKEVKKKYEKLVTTSLAPGSKDLYTMDMTGTMALVFGNEATGISDELAVNADENFIIPQVGIIPSLNVSVACAVSLYEAFRQKNIAGHYDKLKLSGLQFNQLAEEWGI